LWEATGGNLDPAAIPRPDHAPLAGLAYVTDDGGLVPLRRPAPADDDRFYQEIGVWYRASESRPERFRVATIAYWLDAKVAATNDDTPYDYKYQPVISTTDDIMACADLLDEAENLFRQNVPLVRPQAVFVCVWLGEDSLDDVRRLFGKCLARVHAIVVGKETDCPKYKDMAFVIEASDSLTAGEKFEVSKLGGSRS